MHKELKCPSWGQQRADWVASMHPHMQMYPHTLCKPLLPPGYSRQPPPMAHSNSVHHPTHLLLRLGKRQT